MDLIRMLRRFLVAICIIIGVSASPTMTAHADAFGITDELDGLDGDGKYLGQEYRDNYQLDVQKLGIKDAGYEILNAISNGIFSAIAFVGMATISVFYFALDFDIAALLEPMVNSVQSSLRLNVFLPIFQLALVGAFALIIIRFARRDFNGLMAQFGKIIFIFILSLLVVHDSATFLSYTGNITKELSVSIMTGISGTNLNTGTAKYAATASGVLWTSLVHEPWKSLEFSGYDYTDDDVDFFLTTTDAEEREAKVKEIRDNNNAGAFKKELTGQRIGQGAIMFLTMLIKCIVFMIVAVILVLFQAATIAIVLFAPVILLLSLIPGFDFMILGLWCRKILELQIGILVVTFLMGVIILIDGLIQGLASTFGWYVALILQIAMCTGIYFMRYEILNMLSMATMMMGNPRRLRYGMNYLGNPYRFMAKQARMQRRNERSGYRNINLGRRRRTDTGTEQSQRNEQPRQSSTTTSRPSTYQSSPQSPPAHQERYQDRRENESYTGIKSVSYYAPSDVTDNWHELWNNAEKKNPEGRIQTGETGSGRRRVGHQVAQTVPTGDRRAAGQTPGPERPVSYQRAQPVPEGGQGAAGQAPGPERPVSHQG
ncbi:type IV secretion system protein, partial [Lachnoclostridium pacaense]|uniref:type IV secretion system protein n=1 Tax=Enterocloster hominis (ex Hitch et al. 2024) TaxID=1917870 RepID=UPI001D101287